MPKVQISVELKEETLHDYQCEADRQGVPVEKLIEQSVNVLLAEWERDLDEGRNEPLTAY